MMEHIVMERSRVWWQLGPNNQGEVSKGDKLWILSCKGVGTCRVPELEEHVFQKWITAGVKKIQGRNMQGSSQKQI